MASTKKQTAEVIVGNIKANNDLLYPGVGRNGYYQHVKKKPNRRSFKIPQILEHDTAYLVRRVRRHG